MALENQQTEKNQRSNFAAMTSQSWPEFDTRLRIKLQAEEEPPKNEVGYDISASSAVTEGQANKTTEQKLTNEYEKITKCVQETINEVVPEKQWLKKNGRVVTQATRDLFDKRAKEYSKRLPTADRRKRWNKVIRDACTNDYRKWVSTWVETIEKADHKGDTKTIYSGVKALSGAKRSTGKHPTMRDDRAASQASCEPKRTAKFKQEQVRASDAKTVTEKSCVASVQKEADATTVSNKTKTSANKNPTNAAVNKSKASGESDAATAGPNSHAEKNRPRVRISGPEELAGVWKEFLEAKFTPTELEKARSALEELPESKDAKDQITREEFDNAVNRMKKSKAPGPDGIPAEVWQHSAVAREVLFSFLQKVWNKETVPPNLALCIFVMMYKNKGSPDDCTKYRALGLLNHAYKIMSVILLKRLVAECQEFFSDWQAGFRPQRGCRDNVLLLRVLYDQVINANSKCIVTYIDFAAAFDTVSHKFMDSTLAKAGASRKSRAIFRAIYEAAAGIARVNGTDGNYVYSSSFNVGRGVIQGDIISPVLFILALDALVQQYDSVRGKGFKCGRILRLDVLGYADDVALISGTVEDMTRRLTAIADGARADADMNVSLPKTFSHHVHKRANACESIQCRSQSGRKQVQIQVRLLP